MSSFTSPFHTLRDEFRSAKEILERRDRRLSHPVVSTHVWAGILNTSPLLSDDTTSESSSCPNNWQGGQIELMRKDIALFPNLAEMYVCGAPFRGCISLLQSVPISFMRVVPIWWKEARLVHEVGYMFQSKEHHALEDSVKRTLDVRFKTNLVQHCERSAIDQEPRELEEMRKRNMVLVPIRKQGEFE